MGADLSLLIWLVYCRRAPDEAPGKVNVMADQIEWIRLSVSSSSLRWLLSWGSSPRAVAGGPVSEHLTRGARGRQFGT
jgi:hypothetical protein